MKNLAHLLLVLFVAGAAIAISSSCSHEADCSMTGRPMMYCTIYTLDPNTKQAINDTIDSLTITALGTDSIILNNQKKVHRIMLPLRYTDESTAFIFRYDPKRRPEHNDTLYITQQNTPYFQSMECGYMMKQRILNTKIGKGRLANQPEKMDSVYIKNREANTNEIQNLQIFYK